MWMAEFFFSALLDAVLLSTHENSSGLVSDCATCLIIKYSWSPIYFIQKYIEPKFSWVLCVRVYSIILCCVLFEFSFAINRSFLLFWTQYHYQLMRTVLALSVISQLVISLSNIHDHPYIPFKNISHRSSVGSCACEFTVLFSVVFYLVIPEHKFEFSFAINRIHNKRELADIDRSRAIKASNKYVFSTKFGNEGPYLRCQGQSRSHQSGTVRFCKRTINVYRNTRRYVIENHNVQRVHKLNKCIVRSDVSSLELFYGNNGILSRLSMAEIFHCLSPRFDRTVLTRFEGSATDKFINHTSLN